MGTGGKMNALRGQSMARRLVVKIGLQGAGHGASGQIQMHLRAVWLLRNRGKFMVQPTAVSRISRHGVELIEWKKFLQANVFDLSARTGVRKPPQVVS